MFRFNDKQIFIDEQQCFSLIQNFSTLGRNFDDRKRNQIKLFDWEQSVLNIKSFKKPHIFNRFIYRFFRKSKARRSFEYAVYLLERGIGTPQPIAYYEELSAFLFGKSYYVSEHLKYQYLYSDLVQNENLPNRERILREFVHFCYKIHEAGIEFKDHTPGNTLITVDDSGNYHFYLVDLNRMSFRKQMSIKARMKNLSRLTPQREMVRVMAEEYALISNRDPEELFRILWKYTEDFQRGFRRKRKFKTTLKSLVGKSK